MTIQSAGYNGDVTSLIWPTMQLSPNYYIRSVSDVTCTAVTGGTRQVTIGTGSLGGGNVLDTITAAETLTLPTVSSGTNYFMVVMRRNWSTPGSSLQVISGGTSNSTLPARTTGPGVVDDQPLWLVPLTAGQTVPGTPIPIGVYGTGDGERYIRNALALQYLTVLGTGVWLGDTHWRYRINAAGTGSEWKSSGDTGWQTLPVTNASGWSVSYGVGRIIGKSANVRISATYNGSTITVPDSGDIENKAVCTLGSAYQFNGVDVQPLSSSVTGRAGTFSISGSSGLISLTAVSGSSNITSGTSFTIGGSYALD